MCFEPKDDPIAEANRRARKELEPYLNGEFAFFGKEKTMVCKACNSNSSDPTPNGICTPCWETHLQVVDAKTWEHLGGDLEGRLCEDGLVEMRIRGGNTELFISEEALHNAIQLYDDAPTAPAQGTGEVMTFLPGNATTVVAPDPSFDSFDQCTKCGDKQLYGCKCPRSDRTCENGHSWHRCVKHKLRVEGESDHSTPTNVCTCIGFPRQ